MLLFLPPYLCTNETLLTSNTGINAADITKLKTAGYHTVESVNCATRKTLLKIKGFSEIKVDKVKDAVEKCQVRPYLKLWARAS